MSVFTDAIRVLEEQGWHQGGYGPGVHPATSKETGTSVCVLGAIAVANGFNPQTARLPIYEYHQGRVEHLMERVVDRDIACFNDDPLTTYEDVVLALKRAHELVEDAS